MIINGSGSITIFVIQIFISDFLKTRSSTLIFIFILFLLASSFACTQVGVLRLHLNNIGNNTDLLKVPKNYELTLI